MSKDPHYESRLDGISKLLVLRQQAGELADWYKSQDDVDTADMLLGIFDSMEELAVGLITSLARSREAPSAGQGYGGQVDAYPSGRASATTDDWNEWVNKARAKMGAALVNGTDGRLSGHDIDSLLGQPLRDALQELGWKQCWERIRAAAKELIAEEDEYSDGEPSEERLPFD